MSFRFLIIEGIKILQENLLISLFQCISHLFFHCLTETKIKKFVKLICLIVIHKFNQILDRI